MAERVVAQVADKQIIIETGKYAKQADGAVTVQLGETIVVGASALIHKEIVGRSAAALQERYGFRFPLPQLLQHRTDYIQSQSAAEIITDDFAPADIYDVMGRDVRRRQ